MKNKSIKLLSLLFVLIFTFSSVSVGIMNANAVSSGDTITFGSYPQSKVTDESLINSLNNMLTDSYSYITTYSGDGSKGSETASKSIKYQDVVYNGEKYRVLNFNSYRAVNSYTSNTTNTAQALNGYNPNNNYWFKFEPVTWMVLDSETGLAVTRNIIDTNVFDYSTNKSGCDYDTSTIKEEIKNINDTIFSNTEKKYLKNSDGANLRLLTFDEATNPNYGFDVGNALDSKRVSPITDYTTALGLTVIDGGDIRSSNWFTCTPVNAKVNICDATGKVVTTSGSQKLSAEITALRGIKPAAVIEPAAYSKYTLSFVLNGNEVSSELVSAGEKINIPELNKDVYDDIIWDISIPETMPKHNLTITGTAKASTYTLTLEADGGQFNNGKDTVSYDLTAGSKINPQTPVKSGYTFISWNSSIPETMPAENITFKAIWKAKDDVNYTVITYTENLESTYDDYSVILTGTADKSIDISVPKRDGFTFDSIKSVTTGTIKPDGSSEFKIYYSRNKYSLTIITSDDTEPITSTYIYGEPLTITEPQKEGKYFDRWNPEMPKTMPAENLTISAVWKDDNSTQSPGSETEDIFEFRTTVDGNTKVEKYKAGDKIITPETPYKNGYTFICWSEEIPEIMPAQDISITAIFAKTPDEDSEKVYTVIFKINDEAKEFKVKDGDSITAPEVNDKDGFKFKGWDKEIPSKITSDMTFTAQFESSKHYTISISGKRDRTEKYKTTITYHAVTNDDNYDNVYWLDEHYNQIGQGESCTVSKPKNNYKIIAVIKIGNQIQADSGFESVTIKNKFFDKVISFFGRLFVPKKYNLDQR